MTRFNNVDGEKIPFTKREEKQRDHEEKQVAKNRSMDVWISKMELSDDELMSRNTEEHIEHDHRGKTKSSELLKHYKKKKQLRASKPLFFI